MSFKQIHRYYYPNGSLKEKVELRNGIKDGTYESYYEREKKVVSLHGPLQSRGNFSNDLETGYWEFFRVDGTLESSGYYLEGFLNGKWSFYDENEMKYSEVYYVKDKKNGPFYEFYPNGQVSKRGQFVDDLEEGLFYTYYQNEKIYKRFSDKNLGESIYEIILYEKGVITGIKVYDEKGKLITEEGKDPEYKIEYDQNGQKVAEGKIINGKKEGAWIYYNPLKAIEYEKDVKLREIEYYDNNAIKETTEYIGDNVLIKYYDQEGRITGKDKYNKFNRKKIDVTYYTYSVTEKLFDKRGEIYEMFFDRTIKNVDFSKPNGTLYDTIEKGKVGDKIIYTAKGYMEEIVTDKKNGVWKYSFDDLRYEIEFESGEPDGDFKSWIKENDKWVLYTEGRFESGKKIRSWFIYEDGERKERLEYSENGLRDKILYKEDGYNIITLYDERGEIIRVTKDLESKYYDDEDNKITRYEGYMLKNDKFFKYYEYIRKYSNINVFKEEYVYIRFSEDEPLRLIHWNDRIFDIGFNNFEEAGFIMSFEDVMKDGFRVKVNHENSYSYIEDYDINGKLEITIYSSDEEITLEGEYINYPTTVNPVNPGQKIKEFDENEPWKWFKDFYTEKIKIDGTNHKHEKYKYMKYKIDKKLRKKTLIEQGRYDKIIDIEAYKEYEIKTGQWTYYNEEGQIESRGKYEDNMKHGPWEYYTYLDDTVIEEYGDYHQDLKDGVWIRIEGDETIETTYSMGKIIDVIHYSNSEPPPEYKTPEREKHYYILPRVN